MKFYRETEFQETEIGKEWEVVRLGKILNLKNGQRPKTSETGKIPIYGANGIMGYTNEFLVDNDFTIIIGRVGASGEIHLGQGKIWISDNAIYSENYKKSAIYPLFAYYLLKSKELSHFASKTTHPIITQTFLNHFPIQLPPLPEQQKIAEVLSTIDEAIQRTDEIIAKTERLKKALMNELLTGRIRVREENGKLTFRTETEFQETEIGKIPKEWELVKLSDIAEDIYYGITAKAVENETELKMLRTTDIKDYSVNWDSLPFCEITEKRGDVRRFLLKKGDLIIARAGTTGVSVLVEKDLENVIFGSYLIKVKLNTRVYPKFMHYFCQSHLYWDHIISSQAGSTLKNISLPILKSLKVPLPPSIKEQQKIAEILSTVDSAIELYYKEKDVLGRLKKGLMDVLLTGKVRVRED
jgi:type I restriction enzyme S subunit